MKTNGGHTCTGTAELSPPRWDSFLSRGSFYVSHAPGYAHDGFGCHPHAIGRSIRCTCLSDGEMTRWNRTDFIGVLDEQYLPDWAAEKLSQLTGQEQTVPTMDGMTM